MSGKGTPFESMSHEEMLAWLDQANAGEVQSAADRLTAAAKEIRKIGEELKVRPQWVEWKGEGADAFRAWANDLANSTLRLGDFSEGAGKWLGHASDAIATVQASIPRDAKSSQANLDAAISAHNDPDSASVRAKSAANLAALKADQEKVRQEAADQMNKLGQSYEQSASQMNKLERPKFPPPPKAIVPTEARKVGEASSVGPVTSGGERYSAPTVVDSAANQPGLEEHVAAPVHTGTHASPQQGTPSHSLRDSAHPSLPTPEPPVRVNTDSVQTLPQVPHTPANTTGGGRSLPLGDSTGTSQPVTVPPAPVNGSRPFPGPPARGKVVTNPSAPEGVASRPGGPVRSGGAARMPRLPGQEPSMPVSGRTSGRAGIAGGRPAAPAVGRSTGAIPRGMVIGKEGQAPRGSMGRPTAASGGPASQPVGRAVGQPASHATAPRGGVVGGGAQQAARTGSTGRPVSSGAPVRGGISGGKPADRRSGGGGASAAPRSAPSASSDPAEGTGSPAGRRAESQRKRQDRDRSDRRATD